MLWRNDHAEPLIRAQRLGRVATHAVRQHAVPGLDDRLKCLARRVVQLQADGGPGLTVGGWCCSRVNVAHALGVQLRRRGTRNLHLLPCPIVQKGGAHAVDVHCHRVINTRGRLQGERVACRRRARRGGVSGKRVAVAREVLTGDHALNKVKHRTQHAYCGQRDDNVDIVDNQRVHLRQLALHAHLTARSVHLCRILALVAVDVVGARSGKLAAVNSPRRHRRARYCRAAGWACRRGVHLHHRRGRRLGLAHVLGDELLLEDYRSGLEEAHAAAALANAGGDVACDNLEDTLAKAAVAVVDAQRGTRNYNTLVRLGAWLRVVQQIISAANQRGPEHAHLVSAEVEVAPGAGTGRHSRRLARLAHHVRGEGTRQHPQRRSVQKVGPVRQQAAHVEVHHGVHALTCEHIREACATSSRVAASGPVKQRRLEHKDRGRLMPVQQSKAVVHSGPRPGVRHTPREGRRANVRG